MKFIIESLKIRNFKGMKEMDIVFDPIETTICGDNATGKTTVVDAFTWLLFDKDSQGISQFDIKTQDKEGNPIHGLDHSVEGIFKVDGRPLKLKKIYREIWSKQMGYEDEKFRGHEKERFVNDVPVGKAEYDSKINELIDEKLFQLLTDPLHFSLQLHWTERREILFNLAGEDISKDEVLNANPELRGIEGDLKDKTIDELKAALKYGIKNLKKEKEYIPVEIKTLQSTMKEIDKETTDTRIRAIKGSLTKIEDEMLDVTKVGEEQLKKQDELYSLKSKLKEMEFEIKNGMKDPAEAVKAELLERRLKLKELELEARAKKGAIKSLEDNLERGNKSLSQLRKDYQDEADKTIKVDEDINECPTCRRPFSEYEVAEKIEELEENFKSNQVKELIRLRDEGQAMAEIVKGYQEELEKATISYKDLEDEINSLTTEIQNLEKQLGTIRVPELQDLLEMNQGYQNIKKEIEDLEEELKKNQLATNKTDELKAKKSQLELELKELEKDLHQEEINLNTQEEINNLMLKQEELSQQIGELEGKERLVEKYTNTQAELIEKSINNKFKKVAFRLFKKQTNGELKETCEVLVDGVSFNTNVNTAGKVNAGLDIINSLCKHYNTYTPIFIDNRESVNDLIDTDSQLVNLKVTRHKNLRVETE